MIEEVRYNNKILSPQERVEFCKMADATIKDFSDSIEGMHQCLEEIRSSPDSDFNKVLRIFIEVGSFIGFSFCDCVVLTKSFIMAQIHMKRVSSEVSCRFSLMSASKNYMDLLRKIAKILIA